MTRSGRASARRAKRRNERIRAFAATVAVVAVLGFGVVIGTLSPGEKRMTPPVDDVALSLRFGSVLFVPLSGNLCRRSEIDNETWLLHNRDYLDCDKAVQQATEGQRKKWSTDRVEAIRSGLSKR